MKILTLQITADNFEAILKGEQKIETRRIQPNTIGRYFTNPNTEEMDFIKYDALRLINGRSKPAGENPELLVEVLDVGIIDEVDEKGNVITYFDETSGEDCVSCFIAYELGNVINHKNTEKFFDPDREPLKADFVKESDIIKK